MNRTLTPRDAYADAEERLRPGRVVTVHEHGLGSVHRERLRVGDEPADRELEIPPLLDGALRHHARPTCLRADEERDRVQGRVAGDAYGGLDLREPPPSRLRRVRCEQRRALFQVGYVRLVRRRSPCAQLLEREHQLHRVEQADDPRELGRSQPAREADELGARARPRRPACAPVLRRREPWPSPPRPGRAHARRRSGRSRRTPLPGDLHAGDDPALDDELRFRIAGPVGRDQA